MQHPLWHYKWRFKSHKGDAEDNLKKSFENISDFILRYMNKMNVNYIWAVTCDFQKCGILTRVDSEEPVQSPVQLRHSKCCSVSSWIIIKYSSEQQRLWSDCAYAQVDLRLWRLHKPHCRKSHATAHLKSNKLNPIIWIFMFDLLTLFWFSLE